MRYLTTANIRRRVAQQLWRHYPDAATLHLTLGTTYLFHGLQTQPIHVTATTLHGTDIPAVDPTSPVEALCILRDAYPPLAIHGPRDYNIATGMFTNH